MTPDPSNWSLAIAALFALTICHAAIFTPPAGDAFERWCRNAVAFGFGFILVLICGKLLGL